MTGKTNRTEQKSVLVESFYDVMSHTLQGVLAPRLLSLKIHHLNRDAQQVI